MAKLNFEKFENTNVFRFILSVHIFVLDQAGFFDVFWCV